MKIKPVLIFACLCAMLCGVAACTSTPESAGGLTPGSGVAAEGSTLGTDAGSVSAGGAGFANSGNGGGSGSVIGSH